MPVRHAIWKIGSSPISLKESSMTNEAQLEEMIVKDSSILSDRWMLIGQQVITDYSGRIDLLAINQDAQLILIELKRNRTPREVVAQALDYASWVQSLKPEKIANIFSEFSGKSLGEEFESKFGYPLDEEQLDGTHQVVVVASELDASTERIVGYLNSRQVPVNVLFFQVFDDSGQKYLSRAWLVDPIETESPLPPPTGPWNEEYYASFGISENRNWEEARSFGFISGGGGSWYSRTLGLLSKGDRVWVNIPRIGYVGVGEVSDKMTPLASFQVSVNGKRVPFLSVAKANYHREFIDDSERCEYFVPVKWISTRAVDDAVKEIGFFGNQNTVCAPRTSKWAMTVDRLRTVFKVKT